MTVKNESGRQDIGSASPGWTKAYESYAWFSSGANTDRDLLKQHPPIYTENPFTWNGVIERSQQSAFNESGQIRLLGSQRLTGWPVFDTVNYPTPETLASKLLGAWRASEFNLGVSIGEGRESAMLIVDRMTDLAKAANALRKGNLGGALRHLAHVPKSQRRSAQLGISVNALSNAWLELQYGWLPLIKDIGAAAEMIKLHPKENRIKARSSNRGSAQKSSPANVGSIRCTHNDRRIQNIVLVRSPPSFMERLGLSDPLTIAWELTPFSFVLDWFGPIGDYLNALHAINTLPVVKCIQTLSSKQVAYIKVNTGDSFFGYPVVMPAVTKNALTSGSRQIYPSLPTAWLVATQVPRKITNDYDPDLKRIASASALVQQQLRKLLR